MIIGINVFVVLVVIISVEIPGAYAPVLVLLSKMVGREVQRKGQDSHANGSPTKLQGCKFICPRNMLLKKVTTALDFMDQLSGP